jgi:PPOX class probable F420-dependent enzyme
MIARAGVAGWLWEMIGAGWMWCRSSRGGVGVASGMITSMITALPDVARRLIDNPTYAVLTTINADGTPQSTVIWVKRDGGDVLFSTVRGRRKTSNMERDPRVSICAFDPAQPYSYCTVEGTVALSDDQADLIGELQVRE